MLAYAGTTTNQDTFKGWAMPARRPSLGIAMVGDQLYKLIPHSMATPCTAKQTFTTVHRNQSQMCMMVYAGDNAVASKNTLLGQFQLVKLPESQIGDVQVEVRRALHPQFCKYALSPSLTGPQGPCPSSRFHAHLSAASSPPKMACA